MALLLVPPALQGNEADAALRRALQGASLVALETRTPGDLLAALETGPAPHLILLSFRAPEMDRRLVARVREQAPEGVRVLVAAPDLSMDAVLAAREAGGGPLLVEPMEPDALARYAPRTSTPRAGMRVPEREEALYFSGRTRVVGASAALGTVVDMVTEVATSSACVLLEGESGTGKELLARVLHEASGRKGPLVTLNCGALPERLLEEELFGRARGRAGRGGGARTGRLVRAAEGTLFLAEVDALPPVLQARLLEALQEGKVLPAGGRTPVSLRVRVVAGASRSLDHLVDGGVFGGGLRERLGEVRFRIPPLRARSEDLLPLVLHFIRTFGDRYRRPMEGITEEALRLLASHRWPGNVRELHNVMDRAVLRSRQGWVDAEDLALGEGSPHLSAGGGADTGYPPTRSLGEVERDHIAKVLRYTGGIMTEAAGILGIHRNTLTRKVDQFGLREELAAEGIGVGTGPDGAQPGGGK